MVLLHVINILGQVSTASNLLFLRLNILVLSDDYKICCKVCLLEQTFWGQLFFHENNDFINT